MVDRDALAEYVAVGQDVRRLSTEALEALLEALDLTDALDAVAQLEALLPRLVAEWGAVAASAAADFYERSRPGDLPRTKRVLASAELEGSAIGWAATPLFQAEQDVEALKGRLTSITDIATKKAGTDTLLEMSKADKHKPRWARVAVGKTCEFCRMVAKGFVYKSSDTAGALTKWHSACDCQIIPSWEENPSDPQDLSP